MSARGTVTVVGVDGRPLGEAALSALARARLVVGGARHLQTLAHLLPPAARTVPVGADLEAVLGVLRDEPGPRVVLASGDPGFFGIVRALQEEHPGLEVLPATSAVAAAFAAAGLAWDDAHVVSAHGRDPAPALAVCRRFPKVAVLTAPGFGPAALGRALDGLGKRLVVAERLGHPDERVVAVSPREAAGRAWADPNVVLVLDADLTPGAKGWSAPPRSSPSAWALDDDAFDHRDGMVTKAEVRALALAWLGPGPGDLVWDVGAGSGAVAVECALLGAAVVAVERDADACARIRDNAARHGVPLEVVHAAAPVALAGLPDPDAVFVGGGGTAVVLAAAGRARRAVVATLATVERVGAVQRGLAEDGWTVDATLLAASRLVALPGGGHRLAATNPVFVVRGRDGGGAQGGRR